MNNLSEIAKVYLNDIETIEEGRSKLYAELDSWWRDIVLSVILPEMEKATGQEINPWINKSQPGMGDFRYAKGQGYDLFMRIQDPRITKRPFYTVSLHAGSQTALKQMYGDAVIKNELDRLANEHNVGELKWSNTELALQDLEIRPDDADTTGQELRDIANRFFHFVVAHGKMVEGQRHSHDKAMPQ